ncbi:MAG: hypothetical protein CSB24_01825 [Deltaproteobacteria bacterium]|nr:MAG: hypothetical protein CSB24_01825 [Deltaproteobacteria bacterium]
MNVRWTPLDIIDFEYLLALDSKQYQEARQHRQADRDFFTGRLKPLLKGDTDDQAVLAAWLLEKRKLSQGPLPGSIFNNFQTLTKAVTIITALLAGAGITSLLLRYDGTSPVNIFGFFWVLLIPQILLLALMPLFFIFRKRAGYTAGLYRLFSGLLVRGFTFFARKSGLIPKGMKRLAVEGAAGKSRVLLKRYNKLIFWQIFTLFQLFGAGFNLAAALTLLLRVLGTDMAFGWQSTIQWGEELIFKVCSVISMPWSWFMTNAHPGHEAIAGSRIILKDGLYGLTTPDLASWWPFLLMSLLVYGLLPRLILLFIAAAGQKKMLAKMTLDQPRHLELIYRLTTPIVSTRARQPAASRNSLPPRMEKPIDTDGFLTATAFIPDEIMPDCRQEKLAACLGQIRLRLLEMVPIQMDFEHDWPLFMNHLGDHEKICFILLEGWMPPINDTLSYLRKFAQTMPENKIYIGLIGKPEKDNIFTSPTSVELSIWQTKTGMLDKAAVIPLIDANVFNEKEIKENK